MTILYAKFRIRKRAEPGFFGCLLVPAQIGNSLNIPTNIKLSSIAFGWTISLALMSQKNIEKTKLYTIDTRSFNLLAIISLVIQTFIPMRLFIYKQKYQKKTDPAQSNPLRDYVNRNFNKERLFRFLFFYFFIVKLLFQLHFS